MKTINHGMWHRYYPPKLRPDAPPNTMFLKREEDGMDWYVYVHASDKFKDGSVIMTCRKEDDGWVVSAATRDPTMLFPNEHMIIELQDCNEKNPQDEFGKKLIDIESGTFTERQPK